MKKILLFFSLIFLFFVMFPKTSFAQSCTCSHFLEDCIVDSGNNHCTGDSYARCTFQCDGGSNSCVCVTPTPSATPTGTVTATPIPTVPSTDQAEPLCAGDDFKIDTAFGCIPLGSQNEFFGFILTWGIGIAGGIAFLLMIYAGFIIMTSSGNPDRLKAGQELLTSAIMGVVLLIFSVFILRIIGVDILKIPGLGL
ncbi:hypothetical protein A2W13_01145 [Candidatus Woesebacteria bacterium RBG_16_36_11]|uniref:Uncharacterized protein n=3 Tax=Candidatus Woeseibacteriota TaxID=1752722 RepID=A0A1F7XB47_9BACT|nr:MAG: hypothetical protein A2Z67_03150 [Candidatus Woesebacteria bacterium RBG_13_36_22]OGM12232.1 MAG: hypothetical protein A2W13_01145 [Candidatus Woesebacteria bacterium RBG_16_36_11]OGM16169.1 MAG: hypothetical protein A2V55_01375 [Candidatus Woesebacteria bacterium RBG_19FT_COMBO_37_29]